MLDGAACKMAPRQRPTSRRRRCKRRNTMAQTALGDEVILHSWRNTLRKWLVVAAGAAATSAALATAACGGGGVVAAVDSSWVSAAASATSICSPASTVRNRGKLSIGSSPTKWQKTPDGSVTSSSTGWPSRLPRPNPVDWHTEAYARFFLESNSSAHASTAASEQRAAEQWRELRRACLLTE